MSLNDEKKGIDNEQGMDLYGAPKEGDSPPDYETIMNVPDFQNLPPPPQYESPVLEGIDQTTQGQTTGQYIPNLVYADFLPRYLEPGNENMPPIFEDFKTVMNIVNHWLSQNPQFLVIRVEDLERKFNVDKLVLETETTIMHEAIYGHTYFVRGVRLWLVPNTGNQPIQQLWYMNIVPKAIPIPIHVYHRMYGGYIGSMGIRSVMYYPNFEHLDKTVQAVNAKLKESPLPGRALSVVSSDIKYSETWNGNTFNPDQGAWRDTNSRNKLYLTILRIFFLVGTPEPTEIGIQDFAPKIIKTVAMGKPQLEKFGSIVQRAAQWIQQQSAVKVTNVQTVETKVDESLFGFEPMLMMMDQGGAESNTPGCGNIQESGTVKIDPGRMHYNAGFTESTFAKTVRISYLKTLPVGGAPLPPQLALSFRDFIPTRYGKRHADTTSQVVMRINTWLQQTGARVIGVDTLRFLFDPDSKLRIRTEQTRTVLLPSRGHHWITVIRLYLDGVYQEPPPEVRAPTPVYAGAQDSGCCTVL